MTLAPHAPRPWTIDEHNPYIARHTEGYIILSGNPETNALIVAAVNAYEPLTAEVERLRARVEKLERCLEPARLIAFAWPNDAIPEFASVQFVSNQFPEQLLPWMCVSVRDIRAAFEEPQA